MKFNRTGRRLIAAGLLAALCAPSLAAQAPRRAAVKSPTVKVAFKDVKLKNGLRVILAEDHSAPVVSLAVVYNVGSRNERMGRTGFAHLFEHMMFQGSENVGKSEHFVIIDKVGGSMNGTTNEDRTLYFETLPANQLDLGLYLEADRMRSLDISQANLDNQRQAVQEERRLRVDNQPYGSTFEKFGETMYDNFAYKHSVIGSMADLSAATVEDVRDFFRLYYAPNNAVLALVGDFKTEDALARIRKQFESIPSQPTPPAVDMTEPPQKAERRITIEDPLAPLPQLRIGYKGIISNTPDADALQVLSIALAGGQSSRLYQRLVKDKQLATQVGGGVATRRGPGFYSLFASPAPGKKLEEIEAEIYDEIGRLQRESITDAELEKAKNIVKRGAIQSLQSSLGVAINLAESAAAYNDPNRLNTQFERIAAVTKADVQRVANKYLQPANRTVAHTVPKPKAAPTAGASIR